MEVELEQLSFAWRLIRRQVSDGLESENLSQHTPLGHVRPRLLQVLRLVLIELGVEEKLALNTVTLGLARGHALGTAILHLAFLHGANLNGSELRRLFSVVDRTHGRLGLHNAQICFYT